ncbi:MAG TPA: hypothetical protein EYN08_02090 [Gammaproteobacteria bacterium]|nr:hypothetical protein [Gammaproteobacteria bacterium]
MAFLDRKEQVMDTQLTQYGKRLLAQGKFKPVYYAFYDDDIIYDLNWAGGDEEQNSSEGRIKEAIRPDVQYVFSGIETKIKEQNKILAEISDSSVRSAEIQNEADRDFIISPLGTANPHSKYSPAWNINFLKGEHKGTVEKTYKSENLALKIPQIEVEMEYQIKIAQEDLGAASRSKNSAMSPNPYTGKDEHDKVTIAELAEIINEDFVPEHIFEDDTYHYLDDSKAQFFLRILEENSEFLNDNFDIEVFKYNEDDELKELYFLQDKVNNIVDGILMDKEEEIHVEGYGPDYVEYYFDILTDREIDEEVFCSALGDPKLEDIFSDEAMYNCRDFEMSKEKDRSDIYRISKKTDEDPC